MNSLSSMVTKLGKFDKRIVYAVFLLAILVPLLYPLGIPIKTSRHTERFYDVIETLQEGDKVILNVTYDAIGYADVHFQTEALVHHLARRGVDIYFLSQSYVASDYAQMFLEFLEADYGYVYGKNVVITPLLIGAEQGVKTFADTLRDIFPTDVYGNNLPNSPFMAGVQDIYDFELVIASGSSIVHEWWVKQIPDITVLAVIGSTQVAAVTAYIDSGQIAAMLAGIRSAAEYESLLGMPGKQIARMDGQSLGIMTILVFIFLGNVGFFLERNTRVSRRS